MLASNPCRGAEFHLVEEKAASLDADRCSLPEMLASSNTFLMKSFRWGSEGHQVLGQHQWDPTLEFQSGYENLPQAIQFAFALDLHKYVKARHYAWPDVQTPQNFGFIPYGQQLEFAKQWWSKQNPDLLRLGPIAQERFYHDALIDATNIYGVYARKFWDSPKYQLFESMAVVRLIQKK